jgi:hypothetical protein
MSNFLHQKLNEQSSVHLTIQSPNEQQTLPQGSSSPSFLNDQEQQQQIVDVNHQRQTSLDERIRSIFNHPSEEEKSNNEKKKDLSKPTVRKSLPMPPGTSHSNKDHKHISSRKRSASFGGKSTSRKSSSSSLNNKRLASTTTANSSSRKSSSSSKKSRDSKVNHSSLISH